MMNIRKLYLPEPLKTIKLAEGESYISYCQSLPAESTEVTPVPPRNRSGFALPRANILLVKSQRQLTLFDGNSPVRQYPVAIGKPATPTPTGNFAIATKIMNPGGVLGTRWMGLNYDAYGVHGTNAPWLIGQMVSNGCIRMHNAHAEELFALIHIGTLMYIRD
ncbi:L,D-transpeptidase [Sporomusa acidovorans]|uniref:L,D-TPase catalytic domain-containing protein n=1 Tax=Sporomusa acidovorans (strain ATCC 49682 / DSM 3132 / Mol) TaxID=1123286 RepID=A0ABZ3IW88_SPOA4|nr:L,D-transpeptidase [Sporomusa acidovorans]OZC14018.1 putative L,D-transpeptidase YkuD [Sporomusa acidovorans DSM 3132]SDF22544.1 L,D-transpeptidase catalytic domain [Sporomusa acidovorans]